MPTPTSTAVSATQKPQLGSRMKFSSCEESGRMNHSAITMSSTPKKLLMYSIHGPGRNRLAPSATAKNRVPMPSA